MKIKLRKEYKVKVEDKTSVSHMPKIQTIPCRNEGLIVLPIKCSQTKVQPGTVTRNASHHMIAMTAAAFVLRAENWSGRQMA